ncbi:MAG: glycine cleavage system aminomethyltransferase GcvT [Betaproteobacteria bacterium]|nr:glycine cleavage system aminomethyltransferase GcvT [Betaproteobacteria bacterium]
MTRHTCLHAQHVAAGARMTDFGGWAMPLHYGSQIEEHHAVRRAAGMFDVSHMLSIDVSGPQSRPFLRRLLANDVDRLASPGRALYSCMLDETGGILDDLIVHRSGEDRYRLVVNAATADSDLEWMSICRASMNCEVEISGRRDLAMIAVQGPKGRESFWRARPGLESRTRDLQTFASVLEGEVMVARTGYTGEDGFEITLPASMAESLWQDMELAGVRPCGLGARDTLRLEAGMNLYGSDMDRNTTPMESALGWTVDTRTDRPFVGREALMSRTASRALTGLRLLDKGVLRSHMRLRTAWGDGEITSGTFSPTLGFSIAFARVPREAGQVPRPGTPVEVDVRGKWLPACVVKPPFVRHGQSLLDARPLCC